MDKNKEIQAELNEDNLIKLNHKRIGVLKKLFQKVIDGTVTVVSHAPGAKFFVPKILDKINENSSTSDSASDSLDNESDDAFGTTGGSEFYAMEYINSDEGKEITPVDLEELNMVKNVFDVNV